MNIWIFQTGEPLHSDQGNPRPMRAMNLANALVGAGHKVTLWSSAFFHQEKRHRSRKYLKINFDESLEIRLVPSPGYKANIGIGRLFDHAILARNLKKILKSEDAVPDVAFVGYPPIEFAHVAMKWLSAHGVPSMLDAKDQWPQIFVDPFPKALRPLARLGFAPYFYLGREVMREAASFSSMSQSFLNWMAEFSERPLGPQDCVAPLSPMRQELSERHISEAIDWWGKKGVFNDGKKRFFFVGSLSRAFDFAPIAEAAALSKERGKNWQFVICGDGAETDQVLEAVRGLENVIIPGWVDRPQIVALANISIAGLAPYKNIDSFVSSVPNKIIDYLSLGKPIISPLGGEVEALIINYQVGINYAQKNGEQLFEVLMKICDSQTTIKSMSENALNLYEENFSGEKVYQDLVDRLVVLPLKTK